MRKDFKTIFIFTVGILLATIALLTFELYQSKNEEKRLQKSMNYMIKSISYTADVALHIQKSSGGVDCIWRWFSTKQNIRDKKLKELGI
jgi:hypothetical protein